MSAILVIYVVLKCLVLVLQKWNQICTIDILNFLSMFQVVAGLLPHSVLHGLHQRRGASLPKLQKLCGKILPVHPLNSDSSKDSLCFEFACKINYSCSILSRVMEFVHWTWILFVWHTGWLDDVALCCAMRWWVCCLSRQILPTPKEGKRHVTLGRDARPQLVRHWGRQGHLWS